MCTDTVLFVRINPTCVPLVVRMLQSQSLHFSFQSLNIVWMTGQRTLAGNCELAAWSRNARGLAAGKFPAITGRFVAGVCYHGNHSLLGLWQKSLAHLSSPSPCWFSMLMRSNTMPGNTSCWKLKACYRYGSCSTGTSQALYARGWPAVYHL